MFQIDDRQIKQLENELKVFKDRALPFATKATVNRAAFTTQKIARRDVREDMINRNRFTVQSIQVDMARTLSIRQQQAAVGSTADYMEVQEFGGTKVKRGRHGVPIPTSSASNEGKGKVPRSRLPTKTNKLQNIKLGRKKAKGSSRKQKNRVAIQMAAAIGGRNRFVFLDLGRRSGIFKVTGGKRKAKLTKMYDLSREAVTIPRNPWLMPAVKTVTPAMTGYYREALKFQLRKHGLFRG